MGSVWCAITRFHLIKQHQVISSLISSLTKEQQLPMGSVWCAITSSNYFLASA